MEKDKELELKVQMLCAAIKICGKDHIFHIGKVANYVNAAFEALKKQDEDC